MAEPALRGHELQGWTKELGYDPALDQPTQPFGSRWQSPTNIARRKLYADLKGFEQAPERAGLSERDKKEMVERANQAAARGAGTLSRSMTREAMGQGGVGGGYITQAAREAGANIAQAGAGASAQAQRLSEEMIRQKSLELQGRLAAESAGKKQAAQYYSALGAQVAQPTTQAVQQGVIQGTGEALAQSQQPKPTGIDVMTPTATSP
jgi:hypothetical protein